MDNTRKWRRLGGAAGLVASGLVTGGVFAGTLSASADTGTTTATSGSESSTGQPAGDPSQPQRSDEQLLTGDTKAEAEAAVLAKYPGASIQRTETDSDGVHESHVVTTDGQHLVVQVGADFTVTGTDSCPGAGRAPGGSSGG